MVKSLITDSVNMDMLESAILRSAFTHIPNLAYIIDKNCAFIRANQHFLNFLGISDTIEESTPGCLYQHMLASGWWSEQQVQSIKVRDIDVILSEHAVIDEPGLPTIDAEGSAHQYVVSRFPLLDESKVVIGLLVIMKDITQQLIMQEQMSKIKEQLQQSNATTHSSIHAPTEPSHATSPIEQKSEPLKILVVEDNIISQKAAQAVLMQVDCVVDIADSEAQLLTLFEPGHYDMVLMDIGLKDTSGYMVAKNIRAQEKGTDFHVPIIALTGYDANMLTSDCGYYQMEGAITKPLTIMQARQLIQRYILNIDIPVTGLKLAIPPTK